MSAASDRRALKAHRSSPYHKSFQPAPYLGNVPIVGTGPRADLAPVFGEL